LLPDSRLFRAFLESNRVEWSGSARPPRHLSPRDGLDYADNRGLSRIAEIEPAFNSLFQDKLLTKLEENEPELASSQEDEVSNESRK